MIVLEVLSQILPDHTYVTEFRIEGDKLRLMGVTRDAPSLDPLDRAIVAFHAGDFLRADDAAAFRPR